ncbi:DUF4136 domain-containing protein [Pseudomonadota bacterium]
MKKSDQRRSQRSHLLAGASFVLLMLLITACSTGLEVRSDEDPSANFAQYRTFNFFDPMGIEGGYNSPIFGELFRESISRELTQRGYRKGDNPDLIVNVTIRTDDKVSMRTYSSPYMSGGYYSRPGGAHYGSSVGVGVGVGTRATRTTEASVFIDLVDSQKQRVSWQGVAVVDVNDKVSQQLRNAVFTSVNEVFKKYPYKAGR